MIELLITSVSGMRQDPSWQSHHAERPPTYSQGQNRSGADTLALCSLSLLSSYHARKAARSIASSRSRRVRRLPIGKSLTLSDVTALTINLARIMTPQAVEAYFRNRTNHGNGEQQRREACLIDQRPGSIEAEIRGRRNITEARSWQMPLRS